MSCWWTSFFLSSFSLSLFLSCGFFFPFFPPPPPVVTSFFVSKLCFLQEREDDTFSKNVWGGYSSSLSLSPTSNTANDDDDDDDSNKNARAREKKSGQKRTRKTTAKRIGFGRRKEHDEERKNIRAGEGVQRPSEELFPSGEPKSGKSFAVCIQRSTDEETRGEKGMDRADQRGESRTRSEIRGVYSRYWG